MFKGARLGLFTILFITLINLTLGGMSVEIILGWFGKDIPLLADTVIGLVVGEFSIPIAFVGEILRIFMS